ncbi:MAG TPA: alpha/beta fold hydrolase [Cyclobacteriaceae bacterium]
MANTLHHQVYKNPTASKWLVFIHGAGGNTRTWKHQVEVLEPHFNLLVLDLRDHGKSKDIEPPANEYTFDLIAGDVIKVLNQQGITSAVFISLSLGSVVLQKIYNKYPDLIKGIVMVGGVFWVNWKIRLFVSLAHIFNHFLPYRWMYRLFAWLVMPKPNHQVSRNFFVQESKKLSANEYLKWVGLYGEFYGLLKHYADMQINSPMLIVMGAEDWVFLDAANKYAAAQINAEIRTMPACGHVCHLDNPFLFNDILLKFLTKYYLSDNAGNSVMGFK